MPLQRVSQQSDTGCFIACVAMLLGITYRQAFRLLHPDQDPETTYRHGFLEMSMEETAHRHLRGLGFRTRTSKYKKFRTFQNRVQKHAIMIIRWAFAPTLCHCVLFDAEAKQFVDPSGGYVPSDWTLRRLQEQLECAIVIEEVPQRSRYMTFIEVLQLIDERKETIVSDRTHAIRTNQFLYSRATNGEWEQQDLPPAEPDKFPPLDNK
jgi:hypothetical protein